MTRWIAHVDMDAFFASVEAIGRPDLVGRPFYVGGGDRGVVLSANYLARGYGISSGMSCRQARRLCPQALEISPDYERYHEVSVNIGLLLTSICARVEMASIDEAYLDLSGAQRLLGSPVQIASMIRARIADEQAITCSVGIGPNRLIAKMASQQSKPDGMLMIQPQEVVGFLHPLPIEAMWGLGDAGVRKLKAFGVDTIGQAAHLKPETLQQILGYHAGRQLSERCWGKDDRGVISVYVPEKSVGVQRTLARNSSDPEVIGAELLRVSLIACARLRLLKMMALKVSLNLRFADFSTLSKSTPFPAPSDVSDEVYEQVMRLYRGLNLQRARVRRVGVRLEELIDADHASYQPTLFGYDERKRRIEKVIDQISYRYGDRVVSRARLT